MRYSDFTPNDILLLLQGLGVSVALFAATTAIGLLIGLAWAVLRYYRTPLLAPLAGAVAELLKNSPVLVQLFLVFFGLPVLLETDLTPVQAAVITLSGNTAAFIYVIAVSAIESVGREQLETARVFGMSRWQVLRHVVAPQAARIAVAPTVGFLVQVIKGTALASIIGFIELTKTGTMITNATFRPFTVYACVALMYFALCWPISLASKRLERKLRRDR